MSSDHQQQQFKHSPLPDAAKYIRLLSIEHDGPASDFGAGYTLSTWPRDGAPAYHAISYTWGPADQDEPIQLDSKRKVVRRNCADVLRQLCHFQTAKHYWIDTLCINQDDLEEKSQQVAMMGNIYQQADHVFASLGMIDAESEAALRLLCEYDECSTNNVPGQRWDPQRELLSWRSSHTEREVLDIWLLCGKLAGRSYFQRVWTTPELFLAKEVKLYIGYSHIRWQVLDYLIACLHYDRAERGIRLWEGGRLDTTVVPSAHMTDTEREQATNATREKDISRTSQLLDLKQVFDGGPPIGPVTTWQRASEAMTLPRIISIVYERSCCDPRDSIYALLPLLDGPGKDVIAPDYTRSAFDLAVAILEHHSLVPLIKFGTSELDTIFRLISNLRLCRETLEVDVGLQQRTALLRDVSASDGFSYSRPNPACPARYLAGRQLGPDREWRLGSQSGSGSVRQVLDNATGEEAGLICAEARSGDWLLKCPVAEDFAEFHSHDLVVTPFGDRFVFVGLGHVPCWNSENWYQLPGEAPVGWTNFGVHWDASDYITFLASMIYDADDGSRDLTASARMNVGVCHATFSSYAVLKAGALEPGDIR